MTFVRTLAVACATVALSVMPAVAQSGGAYEPRVGQEGKDVVWVPTDGSLVELMLATAKVTPADIVVDLGSGDGRTVIAAAKLGARARGIEFNPNMVELSKRAAQREGVAGMASFVQGDIFETDFSDATVVTMFLLNDLNVRLRPTILNMKPGTRVVSNTFDMGDWSADLTIEAGPACTQYCRGYFWVVPAKVEGTWTMPQGTLTLTQTYQMLGGTLALEGKSITITGGRLVGDQLSLTAGDVTLTGRVTGGTIEGRLRTTGGVQDVKATRRS